MQITITMNLSASDKLKFIHLLSGITGNIKAFSDHANNHLGEGNSVMYTIVADETIIGSDQSEFDDDANSCCLLAEKVFKV